MINDKDNLKNASRHLEDLQRSGQNVAFFQSLLPKLPDPNNSALFDDTILSAVRNHLCEQSDDGHYRYAMVPIVAIGVAAQDSQNRKEFEALAGFFKNACWSQVRKDLFYWNHFNESREGLRRFRLAVRWAYHHLKVTA
jgi:hypothetical protein